MFFLQLSFKTYIFLSVEKERIVHKHLEEGINHHQKSKMKK